MLRRLIRILPGHFAITLVACVLVSCCAVTQASCGNYLHTRAGAPRQLLAESSASASWRLSQQGLLLPDRLNSAQFPGRSPFPRPCSGPHCRQAPAQPFQIPRLPATTDTSVQEAGCLLTDQPCSSPNLQTTLANSGTAAALRGFPPAIEIPPEPVLQVSGRTGRVPGGRL